jgi:tetratricopeptide (TPR) repeat protein
MSMASLPGKASLPAAGLAEARAWQITSTDALAMLEAEIGLVRRELYLGHLDEAYATVMRLAERLARAADLAADWPSDAVTELTVIRAVTHALRGRLEDRGDELLESAVELFAELGRQGVRLGPDQRTDWAIALARLGRFKEAVETLPPPPEDAAARADVIYELGRAYLKHGYVENAQRDLTRAATMDPDDPRIQTELGALELARGERQVAAAAFRAAAATLARQGRSSEALAQCERATEAEPENVDAQILATDLLRSLGRHAEALERLDAALALRRESALLRERAVVLCELDRYREALETAEAAIANTGSSARLEFVRGVALAGLARLPDALTAIAAAAELDPDNPLIHSFRAQVLRAAADDVGALAAIERTLTLDPSAAPVYVMKASILREHGELEAAIEVAREATKLAPDDADANYELGLGLLGAERWEDARTALRAVSKARPDDADVLALHAFTQARLGQADRAIKRFRRALTRDPSIVWARDELAGLLLEEGRPEEALKLLDETMAMPGADTSALRRAFRGQALFQLGRLDEAFGELEQVRALDPDHLYANVIMGKVMNALGRTDDAVDVLTRAAQASPALPWVVQALVEVLVPLDVDAAIEAIAAAQDRGLDRDVAAMSLSDVVRRTEGGIEALDRVLRTREQWNPGLVVRAQAVGEAIGVSDAAALVGALADVDGVIAREPEWDTAQAAKLALLFALGRTDEAVAIIDAVLAHSPSDERFLRAKFAFLSRDEHEGVAEAEEFLRHVIAQKGEHIWAYEQLGRLLSAHGRDEDALGVFDHAIEVEGTETTVEAALQVLDNLGRSEDAAPFLRRALRRNPDSVWLHTRLAEALWLEDRSDEALASLDRSLELDPTDPYALGLRGFLLLERGVHIEPLLAFERALEREPGQTRSLAGKGVCLSEIGEFEESIPFLDRAIGRVEDDSWVRSIRAWALQHTGRLEEALADYEAVATADDADLWAGKGAATCLSLIGGRTAEAQPRFRALLERLEGHEGITALNRQALEGWCRYRLGELDEAIEALTEGIALDPLDAPVQFDLALAIACRGHGRKARAEYERGVALALSQGPRAGSFLRVALGDLLAAGHERPDLAAADDFAIVQLRLEELVREARASLAAQRRA